jgi:TolA-binding protein|tara:strand:- start:51 stop:323 length:273 start_codon:yes stop_codon:yes gene_type:complete
MNEVKKLDEAEINTLTALRQRSQEKVMQFGEIEMEIIFLQGRIDEMLKMKETFKQELKTMQEEELKVSRDLEDKYGKGNLNLETGEFIPA